MWELHEKIHADWEKAYPDSITARVATARFYVAYAWHARSTEYASKVTDEGWRLFKERLAKARTVLDQSKSLEPKCPMWWSASLNTEVFQQQVADHWRTGIAHNFRTIRQASGSKSFNSARLNGSKSFFPK